MKIKFSFAPLYLCAIIFPLTHFDQITKKICFTPFFHNSSSSNFVNCAIPPSPIRLLSPIRPSLFEQNLGKCCIFEPKIKIVSRGNFTYLWKYHPIECPRMMRNNLCMFKTVSLEDISIK